MQLYVAPKISKIPSLVVASIPKLPQCHHTFWTFVRDPGTMIAPWICWKTYSCTERSWQDKCEYPWIFQNTLNFNSVILFFHDSKKRGSLELWEGAGLCVSSHQFILKKSNEFYCKKYPKFKTPPSRGQSPCQGCPHKSCHFWSKRWCCPWKRAYSSLKVSYNQLTWISGYQQNIRVLIYIYIYTVYINI